MYSDDASDTSPSSATNHVWAHYRNLMQSYVGPGGAPTNQNRLFACPADTFFYNFGDDDQVQLVRQGNHEPPTSNFSSYLFNGANESTNKSATNQILGIAGRKLSSIKHPARTILVTEWPAIVPYSWHQPKQPIADVANCAFNNAMNMVGFVDGHVSYI
ncbi:MAG TPA: type II secretion protein, partial [Verrucomicrobiae bacterium]|nr:type II secretion protein [Verrucomicrobiae bacterium]